MNNYKIKNWDEQYYHGWNNKYPFNEVVSFVISNYKNEDHSKIKILDLGCGGGHHLVFLAKEGFDYYGIDGSREGVNIAKQRLEENNFSTNNVKVGTFDNLCYQNDMFDCVIDRGALVCNRKTKLPIILNEIYNVLKPSGRFFSAFLHEDSTEKYTGTHIGNNDYINFNGRLKGAGVLHFINKEEIDELFHNYIIDNIIIQKSQCLINNAKNEINSWAFVHCRK